jgi:hypothetical protein
VPPSHRCDHAVNHSSRCNTGAAATPVDPHGAVEVSDDIEGEKVKPEKKPSQIRLPAVAPRTGRDLQHDRFGDAERAVGRDKLGQTLIDRTPSGPVVLDPG